MSYTKVKNFIIKNKSEWIITIVMAMLSITVELFIDSDYKKILLIFIVLIFVILLLIINLRKLFERAIKKVARLINDEFSLFAAEDKFYKRLRHWSLEKRKIAKFCARKVLPDLIESIFKEYRNLKELNVILDSGTTISPIFKYIINYDYLYKEYKDMLMIYTNNLAGISEVHRHELLEDSIFSDMDFNLFGGQPLNKYRATTGEVTQKSLDLLREEQDQKNGSGSHQNRKDLNNSDCSVLTLGIITANWFILGRDYCNISICASGRGHYDFKKKLVNEVCDYVILISPLGKLLPITDVKELNDLLPPDSQDKYTSFLLPKSQKEKTFLLTTFRPGRSLSPLVMHSNRLMRICRNASHTINFSFWHEKLLFKPLGDKEELYEIELPHDYVRNKFEEVYEY